MTAEARFRSKIAPANEAGCEMWTACTNRGGYGRFWVAGRQALAHRFSWEQANGPIPDGLCALHKCDTPACVNPAHLFLGTDADNVADCARKGRNNSPKGELHCHARLTETEVRSIRRLLSAGASLRSVADRFGVARSTVHYAASGRNWRHVE